MSHRLPGESLEDYQARRRAQAEAACPAPPPPPPPARPRASMLHRIRRAVTFAGAMARWARAGFPLVTAEVAEERQAICHACDLYDQGNDRCTACGCGISSNMPGVPPKSLVATEKCPLNRWHR